MAVTKSGLNDDLDDKEDLYLALSTITQLYTDKTHLVYELLQNAEDCKAKSVKFIMFPDRLEFWHDGKPFSQSNITSIRRVNRSDKPVNDIGKFGVGFKSVFSICDTVELYNEPDNYTKKENKEYLSRFATRIEEFRYRVEIPFEKAINKPYTTRFVFPFCIDKKFSGYKTIESLREALKEKLHLLGADVMLFLKNISEIHYEINDVGDSTNSLGTYMLEREDMGNGCIKIATIGENNSNQSSHSSFIMYTKPEEKTEKSIDIVFRIEENKDGKTTFVSLGEEHRFISVYFPTDTESKLNFIVQAPFATTPNRGGVPVAENMELAQLTADLLRDAVLDIKRRGWLSLEFLNLLPFSIPNEKWLFKPMYDVTIDLFQNEAIFPVIGGGYTNRNNAKIARGGYREDGITKIITNNELALLMGGAAGWMPTATSSGSFTEINETFGKLYKFLRDEILGKSAEIGNDDLPKLIVKNPNFMGLMDDKWLEQFYNHLADKPKSLLGKNHAYSTIEFIKTRKGCFVSAYRQIGREQEPNLYKNGNNTQKTQEKFHYVAEFIQNKCPGFLSLMGVDKDGPDEYGFFIETMNSNANNVSDEETNPELVRQAIRFLNISKTIELCRDRLYLRVFDPENNFYYKKCNEAKIYFKCDSNNISLCDYFAGSGCDVFILDENFYSDNGITRIDLLALTKIGVQDNVIVKGDDEWKYKGDARHKCYNKRPFKKWLDFHESDMIINFINVSKDIDSLKKKSASIFHLLLTVEEHLEGEWTKSYEKWVHDKSEIIHKLSNVSWIFTKEGKCVKPSEIFRDELDENIYGKIDEHSAIYDILGFQKTEQENVNKLLSKFNLLFSKDEIKVILEQLSVNKKEEDDDFDQTAPNKEPFPSEPIIDYSRLIKEMQNVFRGAFFVKYERVSHQIRTSRRENDEKEHIGLRYRGYCQMCKEQYFFWEIAEIFSEPKREILQMNLSLCPACATKYRVLRDSKTNEDIMAEFRRNILNADTNDPPIVTFSDTTIYFTATHLAEIQELLRLQQNETSTEIS